MAYRFKLDEPLAKGVRRVACEQIDLALSHLTDASDPNRSIHQTRRATKRLRALLQLARPALRDGDFERETARFRHASRALSRARDSSAMLEALAKIERSAPEAVSSAQSLASWFEARRGKALQRLESADRDAVANSLHKARRRFDELKVKGGIVRLGQGLQRSYRQARKAFAAIDANGRDLDFHALRKRVQQHWLQVQLFESAMPGPLQQRAALAKELSALLGDYQDLCMLTNRLERKADKAENAAGLNALLGACNQRQAELRTAAKQRAEQLFADKPREFRERVTAGWRQAKGTAKEPQRAAKSG